VQVAADECSSELSHKKDAPVVGEEILVERERVVVEEILMGRKRVVVEQSKTRG
jgi:hypothetical protein